jgi:hypothetical protein
MGPKLNGTRCLLVCADVAHLLKDNRNIMKKNQKLFSDASKEVGVEVNTEKTKYMLMFHYQNIGQIHNIKDS